MVRSSMLIAVKPTYIGQWRSHAYQHYEPCSRLILNLSHGAGCAYATPHMELLVHDNNLVEGRHDAVGRSPYSLLILDYVIRSPTTILVEMACFLTGRDVGFSAQRIVCQMDGCSLNCLLNVNGTICGPKETLSLTA